jgi:hypothetical protein
MTKTNQFRQGDVLLNTIGRLPAGAALAHQGTVPGRVVLAYGEATGHHHSLDLSDGRIALFHDPAGGAYLVVAEGPAVALEHQKHDTIMLPPGIYQMPVQVEYTPAEIRRVDD